MTEPLAYPESTIVFERRPARLAAYLAVKRAFYRAMKLVGLFALARRLTARSLRILCYHGFAIADEHVFSPHTFMRAGTFERRLRYLSERGFSVLGLGEALDRLERGDLPPRAVAITIDDGFFGTCSVARPLLARYGMPATVYVTTYHAAKGTPVFGLAAQYVVWKAAAGSLDPAGLGMPGGAPMAIGTDAEKRRTLQAIIGYGERNLDEPGRARLIEALAVQAGVDPRTVVENRPFSLVNPGEIRDMDRAGIDIQLHTHRHSFPADRERALAEIRDNRAVLEPLVSRPLEHFCYPNGRWSEEQLPWLEEAKIRSAVTCDPGMNGPDARFLALKRFGDSEALSQIEFEAELCGLNAAMRLAKDAIVRLVKRPPRGYNPLGGSPGGGAKR